jgi:hypothetical protein
MRSSPDPRSLLALVLAVSLGGACRFDSSERWLDSADAALCRLGEHRCRGHLELCTDGGEGSTWQNADDCAARNEVCVESLGRCAACVPGQVSCKDLDVVVCREDGTGTDVSSTCDDQGGYACREGSCVQLCGQAEDRKSNVGCEYWAVDLDNAMISATSNAAAQQFAVVVSNPQPDVPVTVTVTQDEGEPSGPEMPVVVATGTIPPLGLQVFKLGPREVDGSAPGTFDTGTGTALTRHAYRVTTTFPVVAYQFNPLENANVFSNDASLLKPFTALGSRASSGGEPEPAYVVVGWPQTIASSDDPDTNFDPGGQLNLRAFLTLVGTRPGTRVRIRTTARVIPGGPVVDTQVGGVIEATLDAYDVLNLETGGFRADFTGSIIESNGPIAVFSGSEASDAPAWYHLGERYCCADHLEEQLDPIRTAGTRYVAAHGPSRTIAVANAGGPVAIIDEPDYFRIVGVADRPIVVHTTLPAPDDLITLSGRGDFVELTAYRDFTVVADGPVILGNTSPSQEAAGIARGLPGGDPSLLVVPPVEQWRSDYVFLTPDKYAFDFVTVISEPGTEVRLDGDLLDDTRCEIAPGDGQTPDQRGKAEPPFVVRRCQLGFGLIDSSKKAPDNLLTGEQNDGVHRLTATGPAGLLVSGFDSFVSYGYAAGTELEEIAIE